jgi:nitroimidazol reductase NimA-like FMN-containing flavoprotein (pyridoxamine 5'-phosphate oxidase superfamily)
MYCVVTGKVMNVFDEFNGEKATVELYQKGQRNLVRISNVPPEIAYVFDEQQEVTFCCDVFPWVNKKGNVTLVAKFLGEDDGK